MKAFFSRKDERNDVMAAFLCHCHSSRSTSEGNTSCFLERDGLGRDVEQEAGGRGSAIISCARADKHDPPGFSAPVGEAAITKDCYKTSSFGSGLTETKASLMRSCRNASAIAAASNETNPEPICFGITGRFS